VNRAAEAVAGVAFRAWPARGLCGLHRIDFTLREVVRIRRNNLLDGLPGSLFVWTYEHEKNIEMRIAILKFIE
jgi:hypothetical protein